MTAPAVKWVEFTDPQADVFESDARFRVLIAGRRFGKTYLSAAELSAAAGERPDSLCWYVAPTYKMAKELAWRHLKRLIPRSQMAKSPNETELSIELVNGSRIVLKGADNPDNLRGLGLNFVVCDEFAQLDPLLWPEVLRPALSDHLGRALFLGTPRGYNHAYDMYLKGTRKEHGWESWTFTTLQGGNVSPEEVAAARSELDPRQFRQEYEASFETLAGRVYDNFDRRPFNPADQANGGNVDDSVKDLGAEVLVGMDFNVNPMTCIVGVAAQDELHIIDSLQIQTSNTEEAADEIKRRYPNRRVIVCPDPSAQQRRTSAAVGVTDITILQRHGFTVDASHAVILIPDRVNAVQAMLKDANGRRRLRVHPRAAALIRSLDGQTYKEGTSIPDKDGGLDHAADALGYLVWQRFNVLQNRRAVVREMFI